MREGLRTRVESRLVLFGIYFSIVSFFAWCLRSLTRSRRRCPSFFISFVVKFELVGLFFYGLCCKKQKRKKQNFNENKLEINNLKNILIFFCNFVVRG